MDKQNNENEFVNDNPNITKEAVEQYEKIRSAGPCNMFDIECVRTYANIYGYNKLVDLDKKDYIYILQNYSDLMELFGVERQ